MIETMLGLAATASGSQTWSIGRNMTRGLSCDEIVEPPRPKAVAGDDPLAMVRLAATGHHAGLHQIDDTVGDDVAVDAEVATVGEMAERLVRHAAEPDLQGRAVVDDRGDVARHHLGGVAGWRMAILRYRRVDAHQCIETVDVDEALAVGPRHCRVHLGNHLPRDGEHRRREVDGDAEADEAASVGRRDLEQGNIDRQSAGRQ